jgi:flagellar biogenesis protein FliO
VSALGVYVLQTVLTLLILGALAYGLIYLQRKLTLSGSKGPLEMLGRLPLDARKTVYLVKIGEQVLVLGASEAGLRLLSTLNAKELPALQPGQSVPLPRGLLHGLVGKLDEDENAGQQR